MANTDSQKGKTLSGLLKEKFDTQIAGKPVALYTLTNKNGAEICITNFGGIVVSLMIPDVSGKMTDVVLGHESIEEYLNTPGEISRSFDWPLRKSYKKRFVCFGWNTL